MKSVDLKTKPEICRLAEALGGRIQIARKRRHLRQVDLAGVTGLSRSAIQSIERGEPACLFGNVLLVLWTLGLSDSLDLIADPGLDDTGLALAIKDGRRRVRVREVIDNDF
ncbi:MAG: helix-turn-helix domain-containing protein [Azoarcus sp.]|nr:helix-turn-helix domain-containing protein [Azoarcus sp.]